MSQAAGGITTEMEESTTGKPPEDLQDNDTNSLEPGEVVTPPHDDSESPAIKKHLSNDLVISKTLRKLSGCIQEQSRKENGSLGTPKKQTEEADDSEGLYSESDSSGEDLKNVEDVQKARKEKQEEAAAASLPQAPPTPFVGINPLRFHMRAPCFDFPRMGFMPRMGRGGPRGMRPPFFGCPPMQNHVGAPMIGGLPTKGPPTGGYGPQNSLGPVSNSSSDRPKIPQSEVVWTALQPPVSFVFNLVSGCSSSKHDNCGSKVENAVNKSKGDPSETTDKSIKQLTELDRSRGKTRDKSQHSDGKSIDRGKAKERSADRNETRRKTRERSKERDSIRGKRSEKSRDKDSNKVKTREKSREKDLVRGKTRERSQEKNKTREKPRNTSMEKDQAGGETRTFERRKSRGKTKDRSRERDRTRAKTPQISQARDQTGRRTKDRDPIRAKSKKRSRSREIRREKLDEKDKKRDLSKEKSKDKSNNHTEKSRDNYKETHEEHRNQRHREGSKEKGRKLSKERSEVKQNTNVLENAKEREADRKKDLSGQLDESFDDGSQGNRSREKSTTKRSKESGTEKYREHSREKPKERTDEKGKNLSKDNDFKSLTEKGLEGSRRAHDNTNKNAVDIDNSKKKSQVPSSWDTREGTPPTTPPQSELYQTPTNETSKPKGYDIFAESPPRPNTAVTLPAALIERSNTPPLKASPVAVPIAKTLKSKKMDPLLKASEIHSRIGALLDDSDLHLEALLATKEQLLRRTNEHKERKVAPKEIKTEYLSNSSYSRSDVSRAEVDHHKTQPRHQNPFKRESVLSGRKSHSRPSSKERRLQRRDSESEEDWDKELERERDQSISHQSRYDEYKEISIKIEKDLTPPSQPSAFSLTTIKIERNATPPRSAEQEVLVRNGAVAANAPPPSSEQESPDTDDYIDNWENDDSMASMPKNAPPATPTPAPNPKKLLPPPATQFNDDDDDEDSNALWNANSTPPPRAKESNLPTSNIHELYDKFMNIIKMSNDDKEQEPLDTSKNSSLSNSTAEESSSGTETSSTSSSSSGSEEDSSSEDDDANESASDEESLAASGNSNTNQDDNLGKEQQQKKNNVSKDLRKLKSLEDNLARIQMMRENYDAGDEISEELLKMESLFLMQRNAIMDKYRKQELKSSAGEDQQSMDQQEHVQQKVEVQQSTLPVNNIFNANREAIKLTISPLKLTRKSAIFDKDEPDQPETSKLALEPPQAPLKKPPKEIAIVKPTIVKSRSKSRSLRSPPPPEVNRRRSRSRSISRNRARRRGSRGKSRSPSPRRWRPPSPRRGSRYTKRAETAGGTKIGRSHSRSLSRSRTRSRSPSRRRRPPPIVGNRKRNSLSPIPSKTAGPRSPPPSRMRRSLSRDRDRERERERFSRSRSPLPFKPPSPPMRRSWSKTRSPTRRRSFSRSRSRSISPRSCLPADVGFMNYFEENQDMEAAAYYYNMSLMQQENQDMGDGYDAYAAYMDSAYNMEQAYAQYSEDYYNYGEYMGEVASSPQPTGSVLRELPMAPTVPLETYMPMASTGTMPTMASVMPVAVQKGNVLEIVPSSEEIIKTEDNTLPAPTEEPMEDTSKPKRKSVNFVDNVLPTYESDNEDRVVVGMAVERALRKYQERRSQAAAKLQQVREELLALPPPPPPLTPKPANLEKPVLVQKKPKMRYFHFDPFKCAIVKTHTRILRPPFDPKHFAMLMKTGRLPQIPVGFLRHRPPIIPAHVDPATRAAILKDFFSKHPPPPLSMPMSLSNGIPNYLSAPPPMPSGAVLSPVPINVLPQPIPVLDGSGYQSYPQPVAMVPSPVPVPIPLPVPLPVPVPVPTNPTPPPATIAPYFTPPPLPDLPSLSELSSQFNVNSVPNITEIMPVDILQKLGPLPKTLDVDDGGEEASPEDAGNDLKEAEADSGEQPMVDVKPQLLVETQ